MAKTMTKPVRKAGPVGASEPVAATAAEPSSVTSRILAEATRLFAEKGFLGTSVQEIVDAANVTKGALYYYYSSKDDLLYEIYHRVIQKELATLDRVLAMQLSPADTVDALITDVMITTAAHRDDVTIFLREMHRLSPEKLAAVRKDRRRYHVAFRGVIEKGQRDGTFRSDISAELVVIGFFGLVHHYYTWYRDDARFSPQYMARESSKWFLESLQPLPESAPKRRPRSAANGNAGSAVPARRSRTVPKR
jgi:AcrR family transcriptional regulator